MKPLQRIVLGILLLAALSGCAGHGLAPDAAATDDPARQVVVAFTDRSLVHQSSGSPGSYAERGANYVTSTWSRRLSATLAADHHLRKLTEWPILSLGVHCVVYAIDDARSLDRVIEQLHEDPRVGSVQPMSMFRVLAGDPYLPLQASIRSMNAERAHRLATGHGVRIAVIDTGIDLRHPDLAGQIESHSDLTGAPAALPFNDDIHGTAVAGVIAALADNGRGIVGVAPGAQVLALRACWPLRAGDRAAVCNSLSLASAIDAAIRSRAQIINLSLTGPADPLIQSLLAAALARNIIVVVAEPPAGEAPAGFIGGLDAVIRVRMAGQAANPDAPRAMITAPGLDVLTTFPNDSYNFISGGSFAAANISGLVALLVELRPGIDGATVAHALRAGLRYVPGQDAAAGIDACAAIAGLALSIRCADTAPACCDAPPAAEASGSRS